MIGSITGGGAVLLGGLGVLLWKLKKNKRSKNRSVEDNLTGEQKINER